MSGSPIIPPQRAPAGSASGGLAFSASLAEVAVLGPITEIEYYELQLASLPALQDGDRIEVQFGVLVTSGTAGSVGCVGVALTESLTGDPSPSTHRYICQWNTDDQLLSMSDATIMGGSFRWAGHVAVIDGVAYLIDGWQGDSGSQLNTWVFGLELAANTRTYIRDGSGDLKFDANGSSYDAAGAYLSILLMGLATELTVGPSMVRVYR